MHVVYFSQELQLRAPAAIGCLYHEATHSWVTLLDLESAIKRREEVTVRSATASELKRAGSGSRQNYGHPRGHGVSGSEA
jgi:hypothetical protein